MAGMWPPLIFLELVNLKKGWFMRGTPEDQQQQSTMKKQLTLTQIQHSLIPALFRDLND